MDSLVNPASVGTQAIVAYPDGLVILVCLDSQGIVEPLVGQVHQATVECQESVVTPVRPVGLAFQGSVEPLGILATAVSVVTQVFQVTVEPTEAMGPRDTQAFPVTLVAMALTAHPVTQASVGSRAIAEYPDGQARTEVTEPQATQDSVATPEQTARQAIAA